MKKRYIKRYVKRVYKQRELIESLKSTAAFSGSDRSRTCVLKRIGDKVNTVCFRPKRATDIVWQKEGKEARLCFIECSCRPMIAVNNVRT